jgi:hypothetical protein
VGVLHAVFLAPLESQETTPTLKEARTYELTKGKGSEYPSTTTATVLPRKDGRFDVSVSIVNRREREINGTGALEKDGLIRFPWIDNFGRKGNGAVRLLDHGTKLDLNPTSCPYSRPWILPWTRQPVLANIHTTPSGYVIHLPGTYENLSGDPKVSVYLDPIRRGKVKISADIPLGSKSDDSIWFDGTGTWKDGDILSFSGTDFPEHDLEKGQLHLISVNRAIIIITSVSTKNFSKRAQIRKFNAKQLILMRNLQDDEGMANDIGW